MNLMFWKKKPGAGNGAEEIRGDSAVNDKAQDSDSIVATQDADEGAPASSNPKTGLTARIKSAFISFTRPFRKAPIFQAGEDYADAQDDSKSAAEDAPAKNTDLKSPDSEIQAKPGLAVRIKSMLATLASRFKKTPAPAPDAEEGQDRDARRRSKNEPEQPEGASPTDLAEPSESKLIAFGSHYKKHLIFTLLFLLLACGLYAAWDTIFPPLIRSTIPPEQPRTKLEALEKKSTLLKKRSEEAQARANAMKKESEAAQAEAEALMKKEAEEKARAEAEALLKKEAEEKAQAEALMKKKAEAEALAKKKAEAEALAKKKAEERMQAAARNRSSGQQQSLDSPVRQSGGGAAPPSSPGEVAISIGQDPKVTAKSLKEAIEIMNSGSAPPPKKPAK